MAMSASTLADAIKSAINSIDFENGEITNDDVIDLLAEAIVIHIQSNAVAVVGSGSSAGTWPIE